VRVPSLRILARSRAPQALKVLLALTRHRRSWFRRRLAPKSPELLAALTGLASYWKQNPQVSEVLGQALHHSDAEIRAAAQATAA